MSGSLAVGEEGGGDRPRIPGGVFQKFLCRVWRCFISWSRCPGILGRLRLVPGIFAQGRVDQTFGCATGVPGANPPPRYKKQSPLHYVASKASARYGEAFFLSNLAAGPLGMAIALGAPTTLNTRVLPASNSRNSRPAMMSEVLPLALAFFFVSEHSHVWHSHAEVA